MPLSRYEDHEQLDPPRQPTHSRVGCLLDVMTMKRTPAPSATRPKGAVRRSEIPAEVLAQLNSGEIETATLAEGLAINFSRLLSAVAPEIAGTDETLVPEELGVTRRMKLVGERLANRFGVVGVERFALHPSDTVRGWAAFLVAALPQQTLKQRLALIRPLADDRHFGVREWAWLALRDSVASQLDPAIKALTLWTVAPSENVRRFASEITRPRGVWCSHIDRLKTDPELAIGLLEPLRSDSSLYVRNSVANWLNDAGKTQADWVRAVCQRWLLESPTQETQGIVKRALRNLQ